MSPRFRRFVVALAFAGCLSASFVAGTPDSWDLPEVALGWPLLLHVERSAALLGLIALAVLVSWRASEGRLPVRLGQLEYAVEDAALETNEAIEGHARRIALLESIVGLRRRPVVSREDED